MMAAVIISPAFPLFFLLLFFSPVISPAAAGDDVSRESFAMDGDVAWIVQVSDLHVSAYHPERADDLVTLLAPALRAIDPSLLLITGDITDAKNKKRTSNRQDESEWIQYRNTMDELVKRSGINKRRIFDIRGNHDKYGVPYVGGDLDFFSIHSITSQLDRLNSIQSISLVGNERNYIFLGIDDTISIGLRGPSNLFGHPTHRRMNAVESELQYWDISSSKIVTKVVFGHFPLSFTASTEKGERYERIFASQSVSAYICGHLHAKFSNQLWKIHTIESESDTKRQKRLRQFWEWELGDWKESRLIRILAVDRGEVSFLDINLKNETLTVVFITYPTDSRSMNRIESSNQLLRNDINALVFSVQPILNATAKVFDSSRGFRTVEEIPLQPVTGSLTHKPLFHAKWNANNYRSSSAARYWLQVFALDSLGKETASMARPFSVEGKMADYKISWLTHLVLGVRWEELYLVLMWSDVGFLIALLLLPRVVDHIMERKPLYYRWVKQRRILFSVLWFLIEGSRNRKLWSLMVIYLLYLLKLPWFWGHADSEDGDLATMYIFGWRIQTQSSSTIEEGVGVPDIMAITLPFMYMVVTPLVLLVYSLFAERSAACLISNRVSDGSMFSNLESEQRAQSKDGSLLPKVCGGWMRRIILSACFVVTFIHLKQCTALMGFYGVGGVALSPALLWAPPLLLTAAIHLTVT